MERAIRFQEACFLYQPQTAEQKEGHRHSVGVMKDIAIYERYQAHRKRTGRLVPVVRDLGGHGLTSGPPVSSQSEEKTEP